MPEQTLSFQRFAQKVPAGAADRIWLGPLRALHGTEKHTEKEWWAIIDVLRNTPAKR
jgi:hypothetical protein